MNTATSTFSKSPSKNCRNTGNPRSKRTGRALSLLRQTAVKLLHRCRRLLSRALTRRRKLSKLWSKGKTIIRKGGSQTSHGRLLLIKHHWVRNIRKAHVNHKSIRSIQRKRHIIRLLREMMTVRVASLLKLVNQTNNYRFIRKRLSVLNSRQHRNRNRWS